MKENYFMVGRRGVSVSCILLISQQGIVSANDTVISPEYSALQGVTVTATRTKRDVFEVAESVTVIDDAQIEAKQATDLADIVENSPNVNISGGPRSSGQHINVRGLSDQRLLYLMDGARQNFNNGHNSRVYVDPELLKQVEIVRGPTTLWGSGALGGVISLTSKDAADLLRPGENWGSRIKSGFQGVNNQWHSSASVFGLIHDNFDYLLDFSFRNASNTRLGNGSDLQHSGFESYAGLAKFTWTPDAFNTLGFSAQTFDQNAQVPSNPQVNASREFPLVNRDTRTRNFTWRYTYENPDHPFIQPSLLVYYNTTELEDNRTLTPRKDETSLDTVGISVKNTMQWDYSEQIYQAITYGLDYYHNEAKGKRNGQPRASFPNAQSDVIGLYLQDEIKLWKRLTLTPGIRWDSFANQANDSSIAKQDKDSVSYKIGLNFDATDWLSFHANYNEAFRAPNLDELFVSGTHFTCGPGCANLFVPNPNLKPEKAHNKEIGFRLHKNHLFMDEDKARFQFSYFHNEVDNFVDTLVNFTFAPVPGNPGLGGTTGNKNVGSALLKGFEVELNYDLPYGYTGFSYAQTRGTNQNNGEALSNIPADRWVLQAGLRYPEWGVSLGWRSSLVEAQNKIPTGGTSTAGYAIHDLSLAWRPTGKMRDLKVDFGIDNITDKDYRKHLSVLKSPGRNYKVSVSWQF